jgi:uncharacterized LabA/DUF88 family protein
MHEPSHSTGPPAVPRRTTVFVDGLNFHYGVARRFGIRWINLMALCRRVLSPRWHHVTELRLYTSAFIEGDGEHADPIGQQMHLRALQCHEAVVLRFGHFKTRRERLRLALPDGSAGDRVPVLALREKGSDVNLAADLVHLAHQKRFEAAVVVSNDSDLAGAIRIVRQEIGLPVGVINPQSGRLVRELAEVASFVRTLRRQDVAASVLPSVLHDAHGPIECPPEWGPAEQP